LAASVCVCASVKECSHDVFAEHRRPTHSRFDESPLARPHECGDATSLCHAGLEFSFSQALLGEGLVNWKSSFESSGDRVKEVAFGLLPAPLQARQHFRHSHECSLLRLLGLKVSADAQAKQ